MTSQYISLLVKTRVRQLIYDSCITAACGRPRAFAFEELISGGGGELTRSNCLRLHGSLMKGWPWGRAAQAVLLRDGSSPWRWPRLEKPSWKGKKCGWAVGGPGVWSQGAREQEFWKKGELLVKQEGTPAWAQQSFCAGIERSRRDEESAPNRDQLP